MGNASERRCKATNRRGERCAATVVNAAGYCVAHDPERPADMRELGRRSVQARARQRAQAMPTSLREKLRELEPGVVKAACEEILAGNSQAPKVSVIRLLTDLEVYKADTREEWERERNGQMQAAAEEFMCKINAVAGRSQAWRRHQLREILEPLGLADLAGEHDPAEVYGIERLLGGVYDVELEIVRELARRLAAIPAPIREEHAPAS